MAECLEREEWELAEVRIEFVWRKWCGRLYGTKIAD